MLFRLALTHHTQTQLSHALRYLSVHLSLSALPLLWPPANQPADHRGLPGSGFIALVHSPDYCFFFLHKMFKKKLPPLS